MGVHVSVPHSNRALRTTRRPKVSTVRIEMMVAATNTAPVMTDDSRAAFLAHAQAAEQHWSIEHHRIDPCISQIGISTACSSCPLAIPSAEKSSGKKCYEGSPHR